MRGPSLNIVKISRNIIGSSSKNTAYTATQNTSESAALQNSSDCWSPHSLYSLTSFRPSPALTYPLQPDRDLNILCGFHIKQSYNFQRFFFQVQSNQ